MESKSTVSVVIPTHKARERTLRCLAALWLCKPQPDEVIVVDDGSDDNTAHSVLRKYPRHIVVHLPKRHGFAAAINHGVARASGELLLLLDNRTEVAPTAINAIHRVFEARENLGVAGAVLRRPNGDPEWSGGRLPSSLWCFASASGLPALFDRSKTWRKLCSFTRHRKGGVDWVSGAATVVRRTAWEEIGPFDAGYRIRGQYLELCAKASEAGWKVEIVPDFHAVFSHDGPESSNEELMWVDLLRFAGKRSGSAGARQSRRALRMGGRLRVIGRQMAAPLVPKPHKKDWVAQTDAFVETLRLLRGAPTNSRHVPRKTAS